MSAANIKHSTTYVDGTTVIDASNLNTAHVLDNQSANTIFAGPTTGAPTTPDFRAMVQADVAAHGSAQHDATVFNIGNLWNGYLWPIACPWRSFALANQAGVAGRVFLIGIGVPYACTVDAILYCLTVAGAASTTARLGIYPSSTKIPSTATPYNQTITIDGGTVDATLTLYRELVISDTALSSGIVFACLETQDTTVNFARFSSTVSTLGNPTLFGCKYDRGGGYGALTTPCPAIAASDTTSPMLALRVKSIP